MGINNGPSTPISINQPTSSTPKRTPSLSEELGYLISFIHRQIETLSILDGVRKRKIDMLFHAAKKAFADRTIILAESRELFGRHLEKQVRKSRSMAVLETARVMTYDDLENARKAAENKKGKVKTPKIDRQQQVSKVPVVSEPFKDDELVVGEVTDHNE